MAGRALSFPVHILFALEDYSILNLTVVVESVCIYLVAYICVCVCNSMLKLMDGSTGGCVFTCLNSSICKFASRSSASLEVHVRAG